MRVGQVFARGHLPYTILLLIVLAGCGGARRFVAAPPVAAQPVSAAEAIAALRSQEQQVQTLRARFTAAVRSPSQQRVARGVVLAKKPDHLRLRMWSGFGLTVLDYVASGSQARMQLPLEGKTLVGEEVERSSSFSPSAFAPVFLLEHALDTRDCRAAAEAAQITCSQKAAGGRRTFVIGLAPPAVLRETLHTKDGQLPLEYSDFRAVDGKLLPFRIVATDARSGTRMQIDIEAYEVNPTLSEALFDASGSAP